MNTPLQAVEAQAMQLTAQERADLADKLWLSVNSTAEVEQAWQAEILRRLDQVESGDVVCRPWADVMAEMTADLQLAPRA